MCVNTHVDLGGGRWYLFRDHTPTHGSLSQNITSTKVNNFSTERQKARHREREKREKMNIKQHKMHDADLLMQESKYP